MSPLLPLFLLCYASRLQAVSAQGAHTTVLLTGDQQLNVFKLNAVAKFVNRPPIRDLRAHDIIVLNRGQVDDLLDHQLVKSFNNVDTKFNISTVVVTGSGLDQMSIDQLAELEPFLRTERGLLLVEIGKSTSQAAALLDAHALCWGVTRLAIDAPNTAHMCNSFDITKMATVLEMDELRTITQMDLTEPQARPFWPCLFASAAKADKKSKKIKVEEITTEDIDDEVEQILERVQEAEKRKKDDDDDDEFDNAHDPKRDHRLHCKYRKSCYTSGKRGLIEPFDFTFDHLFHFWAAPASQQHHMPKTQDADGDGIPDSEDEDVHLSLRKLSCKYRPSCYKENEIPLSDKLKEREESRSFMSAKLHVPTGKKKTLKDIAEKTVSVVKEQEERAKSRPMSNSMIVEKKLQAIESELQKKIGCKYRKSCYKTGNLPEIEPSYFATSFSLTASVTDEEKEETPFEELKDDDKKLFCKYRKSCYETGTKPDIEAEIQVNSISDIFEVPQYVETRKMTLKERCKYRKSCYETGVVPDLGGKNDEELVEKIADKEVSRIIPANVNQLKMLCKYRKSCYSEVAEAETTADTVAAIRTRQVVEREVKRRRARLHRRHRRHHGHHLPTAHDDDIKRTIRELDSSEVEKTKAELNAQKTTKKPEKKPAKVVAEPKIELKKVNVPETKKADKKKPSKTVEEPVVDTKKNKKTAKKTADIVPPVAVKISEPVANQSEEEDEEPKAKKVTKKIEKEEPTVEVKAKKSLKKTGKIADPESEAKSKRAPKIDVVTPVVVEVTKPTKKTVKDDDSSEEEERAKQKKSSKKTKTEDVEPKVELKKVNTESGKKHDDDDDEFDNVHDPKRDHRLHCKYRKSCYETGKRGLIEPFDFSIHHLVHFWAAPASQQHHQGYSSHDSDGDGIPDHQDTDFSLTARKLLCKYRPSCYADNDIPIGEHIVKREELRNYSAPTSARTIADDDDDDEDESTLKKDARLTCKYRKSCYESGVVPDIHADALFTAPPISEPTISYRVDKLSRCKYRKSCYKDAGIAFDDSEDDDEPKEIKTPVKVQETVRKPQEPQKKAPKKKTSESDEDDDDDDADDDDSDETEKEKKTPVPVVDIATIGHIHSQDKLSCKYRKACYSTIKPRALNQDHSGTIARTSGDGQRHKCHEYYYSCREQLGLPPKEKAPIGPNGKRLCRKKTPATAK